MSRVQRLKYRAWRRGMRECDLVLEAPDDKLWTWILGSAEPDPAFAGPMLDRVIAFGREELA